MGVDGLPDYILKDQCRRKQLKAKLKGVFEDWLNGEPLPTYMKTCRVVALSKEDGQQYPKLGKIRTIAVAPSVMKLYEKIIHQKLWKEIDRLHLIADNQNAYKKNCSTLNNLEETINQMRQIHCQIKQAKIQEEQRLARQK